MCRLTSSAPVYMIVISLIICVNRRSNMYIELKENKVHGTKEFPFIDYHIYNIGHPYQLPVHWHDEFEVIYVEKGNFRAMIDGTEYESTGNDIFFVNPGELHFMGSTDGNADYHTFVFPLELISFQSSDDLETGFFGPLRNGTRKLSNTLSGQLDKIGLCEILRKLSVAYQGNDKQFQVRILLLLLFCSLTDDSMRKTSISSAGKSSLGKNLVSYLQQHYMGAVRLSDLATELHLSEKYISRYFKESFHLTISQYLEHLRLTQAKHLLKKTDLAITEVALQAGFSDVSYFVRRFHKVVGTSPLRYRKNPTD
ncbi:AraC family transcriptional regulator [Agathobacter ruminis]|uniref:AraC family transcriptional regulator n=2 Tax=Agathobacter ruminis TaxID=1712665 RepID=A0A2G3E335_9FIRM|nr:AraC family transcriptional regulator [Agathobacter ruminis]